MSGSFISAESVSLGGISRSIIRFWNECIPNSVGDLLQVLEMISRSLTKEVLIMLAVVHTFLWFDFQGIEKSEDTNSS